jgi:hypothetical protein
VSGSRHFLSQWLHSIIGESDLRDGGSFGRELS